MCRDELLICCSAPVLFKFYSIQEWNLCHLLALDSVLEWSKMKRTGLQTMKFSWWYVCECACCFNDDVNICVWRQEVETYNLMKENLDFYFEFLKINVQLYHCVYHFFLFLLFLFLFVCMLNIWSTLVIEDLIFLHGKPFPLSWVEEEASQ